MSVFVENSKCGGVLVDDMVPQTVYQRFLCFCNERTQKEALTKTFMCRLPLFNICYGCNNHTGN